MFRKIILVVASVVLAWPALADEKAAGAARIAYAKTPVADLDRSLKFYTMLGLKRSEDAPGAAVLSFEAKGSETGPRFILLHGPQYASYKSAKDFPRIVFEICGLRDVVKRLTDAGYTASQPNPNAVYLVSIAQDPDGHPVELLDSQVKPGDPPASPHLVFAKGATADIALSVVFYTALGLESGVDYPGAGRRLIMMFPGRDGRLALRKGHKYEGSSFILNHGPKYQAYKAPDDVSRIAFAVPDINYTVSRLTEVGFEVTRPPHQGDQGVERGHQVAFVKDHDGQMVELLQ